MLNTVDLEGTSTFYTEVLGFELDNMNVDWGWMHLHKDGVSLMFCLPNAHAPFQKPVCTGSFYFYTDEVETLLQKLKGTPHVYYGLEDFDYGMHEFAIKDNNGYTLQFGRDLNVGWGYLLTPYL